MIIYNYFGNGGFGANLLPVLIVSRMTTEYFQMLLICLNILIYDTIM